VSEEYFIVHKQLQHIRQKYTCEWVLDGDNIQSQRVLEDYDLLLRS